MCPKCLRTPLLVGRLGIKHCDYCGWQSNLDAYWQAAEQAARELAASADMPTKLPNPADTGAAMFRRWRGLLFRRLT